MYILSVSFFVNEENRAALISQLNLNGTFSRGEIVK